MKSQRILGVHLIPTCPVGLFLLALAPLAGISSPAKAGTITLGTAGNFSVLAGTTVTNTGPTVVTGGDVGVSPGSSITGFPPGTVAAPSITHSMDAVAAQAQTDLTAAYNQAVGQAPTETLTGQDLGGLVLLPGTYFFASTAQLTGMLTLDDMGNPNAQFDFEIGSTLTTASNSSVVTINGGTNPGSTVFWQVGSSATLGTGTAFEGHILALTSITLDTGATLFDGSVLARNGAVTLDDNSITNAITSAPSGGTGGTGGAGGTGGTGGTGGAGGNGGTSVPLPNPAAMGLGLLPIVWLARRRFRTVRQNV